MTLSLGQIERQKTRAVVLLGDASDARFLRGTSSIVALTRTL